MRKKLPAIGQAVLAGPKKYEGYVVQHERYGQKGSVCVYINWDGDGVYTDWRPEDLKPIDYRDLSASMLRSWKQEVGVTYLESLLTEAGGKEKRD